jgi:hypothetical protein
MAVYAPVVVMGGAERETSLKALIAAGVADYVPRSDGSMNYALNLLEDRLAASGSPNVFPEQRPRSGLGILLRFCAMN